MTASISMRIEGIRGEWAYAGDVTPSGAPADWIAGALVRVPTPAQEGYDPDTGQTSTSRVSVELNALTPYRSALLYQATEPVARIVTLGSSTSCTLDRTLGWLEVDDELYLAGETLRVLSVSGPDLIVQRMAYSVAEPRAWAAGDWVWRRPPYWRRRAVTLRTWPGGATIWRGLLDQPPRTSPDGARILLEASGPQVLEPYLTVGEGAPVAVAQGRIVRGLRAPYVRKTQSHATIALQVGEQLYIGALTPDGAYRAITGAVLGSGGARDVPEGEQRAYEVLATGRLVPPEIDPLVITGVTYPHHPVSVACALLFSRARGFTDPVTWDVLSTRWSAGLYAHTTPQALAALAGEIEATRWQQIDHLVLGWDGEPVTILPVVRAMLLAWGWVLTSDASGALTIVRAPRSASYADTIPTLDLTRDISTWEQPRGGVADRVVASIGGLPWIPAATISLQVQGAQASYPESGETQTLDLSTLSLAQADGARAGRILSLALARWRGQPALTARIRGGAAPALGGLYRLTTPQGLVSPIYMSPEGDPVASLEGDAYIGQVVTRLSLTREQTWQVTVRLTSWPLGGLLRLRAPSATIEAVSGDTYTVGGDYGQLGEVAATFAIGDIVQAVAPDGVRLTGAQAIATITGDAITLDAALDPAPALGSILRLADLADWTPDPRIYTYVDAGDRYA